MTEQEFIEQENKLLSQLPPEFRGPVSYKAYENGHGYGYENVLWHVEDLVDMLKEPLEKFVQRTELERERDGLWY